MDIKTLSIATALIIWGNAIVATIAWRYEKSQSIILGYWSLSQILAGIGFILVAQRGSIPNFFSIMVATALILSGQIATQEALALYMGRQGIFRKAIGAVFCLLLLGQFYFTYVCPSVGNRILLTSIAAIFMAIFSIRTLQANNDKENPSRRTLAMLYVLLILLMLYRLIAVISHGEYSTFLNSGPLQAWGMTGLLCFCACQALCFFWLISHRLGEEVKKQALTDSLTGLANRRALDGKVEKILTETADRKFGLLLVDVDRFKEINDQYGHQAGDEYLIRLGEELKNNLREKDTVFRYAGDEFVVLVQNNDGTKALHTAERLRQKIADMRVPWQRHSLQSTVSIGIALEERNALNSDDYIRIADKALYQAKAVGGNCVKFEGHLS